MIWSDLTQDILSHVPGCPEPLIEDTIKRIATQFCRETHIWEEQLQDIYLVQGVERYQVELPEESELLELSYLKYKKSLSSVTWPDVNVFGLLSFHGLSFKSGPVEIKAILVPAKDSTGLPDRIGEHYREALIAGTIGKLQAIPRKDWSAPELAPFHMTEFNQALAEAKIRKCRGNTSRPMRVASRPLL